jgi:anti-sigma regulatory factor (Ser/Thr protein kinase)
MGKEVSKKRPSSEAVRRFLLDSIASGLSDVAGQAAAMFRISRQAVNGHLRRLVAEGLLEAHGVTRGRRYRVCERVSRHVYPISDALTEHEVWEKFVRPLLGDTGESALRICQYGCTEMVNNAIEHSGGTHVEIQVRVAPTRLELTVRDDGVGIFRKIRESLGLEDDQHAVLELSKGKLTTDPRHHTGEGVFFTSRVFDEFSLRAGQLLLAHTSEDRDWLRETGEDVGGTMVVMRIAPDTGRSLKGVFDAFASAARPFSFAVTHVPVALATVGADNLVSRSQARRLVTRLDLFDEVILDFTGVKEIGQAFADEVFRVFASEHPNLCIGLAGANEAVTMMVNRALEAKREQAGGTP